MLRRPVVHLQPLTFRLATALDRGPSYKTTLSDLIAGSLVL